MSGAEYRLRVTRTRQVVALAIALVVWLTAAPAARASFPGSDGLLLFMSDGDLFLVRADGTGLRPLTSGTFLDEHPSWSADGKLIAFVRDGVIHTMWADGTHIRSTGVVGFSPRWYPDRTRIAFWNIEGVWTMRPSGRGRRLIFETRFGPGFEQAYRHPVYSVDGNLAVSFSEFTTDSSFVDILVESPPPLNLCEFDPERADWSPDGRMLAVTGFDGTICLTDGRTATVLPDVFSFQVAWSPEGDRLALRGGEIIDLEGNVLGQLPLLPIQVLDWQPRCTATGTPGDDVLSGTDGDDVICGLGGDDSLFGLEGSDVVYGGSGDDYLNGGPGDDLLYGGFQADRLFGRGGDDFVSAGPGPDVRCNGGSGTDRAEGCELTARIP